MEFSLLALIGIAVGMMFFGYFFGLVEGRAQGYKRRDREEPPDHNLGLLAEERPPAPASDASVGEDATHSNSWLELAGEANGQPHMDLDGQRVNTADLTPAQHQRLIDLLIMMRPWVEAASPARETETTGGAPVPRAPNDGQPASSPPAQKSMAASALATPASGSAGGPGMPSPGDVGGPTSMVAQIDTILQARLQGTTLGSLGIRLAESLHGGAVVFVGKQMYAGVADVPDARVQAAIREAIAEWEKRFTPG